VTPTTIESTVPVDKTHDESQRNQVADAIERRTAEIVARWLEQVRKDADAAHVSLTDLQDGIAEYLHRLARLLRGRDPIARVATSAWNDIAREHALTRVRLGFDVAQLVHEIVTLRRLTAQVLRDEGLLSVPAIEIVTEIIDAAMTASLQSYVDFRDYAARRVEAEHIGFLTHDLKNPLGVAIMASEQLCDQAPSQEQRKLCEMIDRSLARLRRMIDEVLLTERLQAGAAELRPIEFTLQELFEDSLASFERRAQEKHIGLDVEFDPATELRADPNLTLSAVENLLDNAIKYTDAGTVTLRVEDHPDEVVFHVRDQCGGLSREQLEVIFEPFKRAHQTKPGSGLGLSITRRATEAQGGTIHAESGPAGCHFWFTLPKRHH
jgi:signal transduction histidine kinase